MIAVLGRSGSGKNSLISKVLNEHPFLKYVTPYTTRPKRSENEEGYHFISREDFFNKASDRFFLEVSEYNGWWYGIPKSCIEDDNNIAIITPSTLRLLWDIGEYPLVIWLDPSKRSSLISCLNRGDDINEAYRRSLFDDGAFEGMETYADYICPGIDDMDESFRIMDFAISNRYKRALPFE